MTPVGQDEDKRIAAVRATNLLDTPPHDRFDRIVRLAAAFAGTTIAAISLLDNDRLWFKASVGVEQSELPRVDTFCTFTVDSDDIFSVEDAIKDMRFSANPYVTGPASIRFYAGIALHDKAGFRIGTLCVSDTRPHRICSKQELALKELSVLASEEIQRFSEIYGDIANV